MGMVPCRTLPNFTSFEPQLPTIEDVVYNQKKDANQNKGRLGYGIV
jgi:hypothetical protein